MSFTKQTLENIFIPIRSIQTQTLDDNDLTVILEALNCLMDISENFTKKENDLSFYWNEIVSDSISVIYSGVSGNYRLAISGLRNILELACHAFYYLDHKIELKLFINENHKADKYIGTLISEHFFFTTAYVKTFCSKIEIIQKNQNSVSAFLNTTYGKLCDVVHGRYKSLTKTESLKIEYSKEMFLKFHQSYAYTLSCIACLYVLRFNDFSNPAINKIAKYSNTIEI